VAANTVASCRTSESRRTRRGTETATRRGTESRLHIIPDVPSTGTPFLEEFRQRGGVGKGKHSRGTCDQRARQQLLGLRQCLVYFCSGGLGAVVRRSLGRLVLVGVVRCFEGLLRSSETEGCEGPGHGQGDERVLEMNVNDGCACLSLEMARALHLMRADDE
jgi:hypothetical protein